MWRYHTLAYAVHEATRRVSSHGRGCVTGSTWCPLTVGDIATNLAKDGIGIPADTLNVTLTTDSGAVTTCNPSTSCTNNSTRWPPSSNLDNASGKQVTITASLQFTHSMVIVWPEVFAQRLGSFLFPASSTETIVF
jgi:hypothetical protein